MAVSVSDLGADVAAETERPADSAGRSMRQDFVYICRFVGLHIKHDPVWGIVLWGYTFGASYLTSYISVQTSIAAANTTNALVARNHDMVVSALLVTVSYIGISTFLGIMDSLTAMVLRIRIRTTVVHKLLGQWMTRNRLYSPGQRQAVDHPEQRVQEDTFNYALGVVTLIPMILGTLSSFYLYSDQLWQLSNPYPISLPNGVTFAVPKALYVLAIASAIGFTVATHLVGRALTRLEVVRQRLEAGFRHDLRNAREYGEQVILSRGEPVERARAAHNYRLIQKNWTPYAAFSALVVGVQMSVSYLTMLLPTLILFPLILANKMQLGDLDLAGSAFGAVFGAFAVFVSVYQQIALLRASAQRLHVMEEATSDDVATGIEHVPSENAGYELENLTVGAPDGKTLVTVDDLRIGRGEKWLIKGPSGAGKSTLFRAIGGIWPFGDGTVREPANDRSVMLLPQTPYLPEGSLAELLSYPQSVGVFADADYRRVLEDIQLGHLVNDVNTVASWAKILSPGEQQRLVLGRALLQKPDVIFLDEATSALDSETEQEVFGRMIEQLGDTAMVTIAHTDGVTAHHDHVVRIVNGRAVVSATA